ncbi:MAG: prohibitin family protein [Patescibacteria group bacterium]|nr:prohibitin family protein [Patescibacteria group bacterium]
MFDKLVVSFLVDEVAGGFFVSVPPGHVACVYDWGRGVLKKTWSPGLHFKIPFWQTVKLFNAQTLEYTIRDGFDPEHTKEGLGDEPITAVSYDNVPLIIQGTILIRIDRESVVSLWESVGEDFVSKIIRPVSRSRVRTAISQFLYKDIQSNRHFVEQKIREELEAEFRQKGLIVEGVLLSDIGQKAAGS